MPNSQIIKEMNFVLHSISFYHKFSHFKPVNYFGYLIRQAVDLFCLFFKDD